MHTCIHANMTFPATSMSDAYEGAGSATNYGLQPPTLETQDYELNLQSELASLSSRILMSGMSISYHT